MDKGTVKIVVIATVVIIGLNMLLDTILEIRKANLELVRLHMNSSGNRIVQMTGDGGKMMIPKSRSGNGRKLLVDPKIRDMSNNSKTLNLAEITRLVCDDEEKQNRMKTLELHSDSDKTLSAVYAELLGGDSDGSDGSDQNGVHSGNYYDNHTFSYEAPLNSKIRDINEMNIQEKLITEHFHGIAPKQEYPVGNHFNDVESHDMHPGDRSWSGNGGLRNYFNVDPNADQFTDPDIRAPPTGKSAPAMQRKHTNSSETSPWVERIANNRVYKVDNWMYENEKVMNGGNFGILSPFDTFGSDFACV